MAHIVGAEGDEIGACHTDATLLQHPALVGDIGGIFGKLRIGSCIAHMAGATLDLVDCPAAIGLAEDIHSAIVVFRCKSRFADHRATTVDQRLGLGDHSRDVQFAVCIGGGIHILAKERFSHVANLVARSKTRFDGSVDSRHFGFVGSEP